MGRSWSTSLGYHRGVDFIGALGDLVASDSLNTTLNGYVNPRLQVWVTGMYSKGFIGTRHGEPLTTYSAVSRMQYALSRKFALELQYLYYFYEFGADVTPPAGVAQEMSRQSIRGGLTLWLPALR
jgi:hypothetical protein